MPVLFTEAARVQSWLDVGAALAELTIIPTEMPDTAETPLVGRYRAGGPMTGCADSGPRSSCNGSGTPAALLARPCTLLTLSELSFTVREVFFSFGPHTHHEPVGRCVATIDLHFARVRPQGCARDHRGRQRGGR